MRSIMLLFITITVSLSAFAQVDLTAGGSGTTTFVDQSFNETRGVDITVLSSDIHMTGITLRRLKVSSATGFVGLRIYNSTTQALLLKKDSVVQTMQDDSVAFSVSFVLKKGEQYRISFHCYDYYNPGASNSCSGYMYVPNFPYTEASKHLMINGAYQNVADTFPGNVNLFMPFIAMKYDPVGIDDIKGQSSTSIYPNPFTQQAIIKLDRELKNAKLNIINSLGQVVRNTDGVSGEFVIIQRHNLAAGVYYIELREGGEIVFADRVVVQN